MPVCIHIRIDFSSLSWPGKETMDIERAQWEVGRKRKGTKNRE